MQSSPTITKLAEAMAQAQSMIKPPQKTKTAKAGSYTYKYCDLSDLIAAINPPLSAAGLSFVQGVHEDERGNFNLKTRLMHASGEWLESDYPLAFKGDAQQKGSELTYARRYALSAMVGVAPEDDRDGADVKGQTRGPAGRAWRGATAADVVPPTTSEDRRHRDAQQPQRVERLPDGQVYDQDTGEVIPPPAASGKQVQELRQLLERAKAAGVANEQTAAKWHAKYGVQSFEQLSSTDCMRLIQTLRGKLDAAPRPVTAAAPSAA